MFEPFYMTKSEGMGIGLAISRSIIEAHGGKLRAMKDSPRGAIFLFSLPASDGELTLFDGYRTRPPGARTGRRLPVARSAFPRSRRPGRARVSGSARATFPS